MLDTAAPARKEVSQMRPSLSHHACCFPPTMAWSSVHLSASMVSLKRDLIRLVLCFFPAGTNKKTIKQNRILINIKPLTYMGEWTWERGVKLCRGVWEKWKNCASQHLFGHTQHNTTQHTRLWLHSKYISTWTSIQLPCLCNVSFTEPGPLADGGSHPVFVSGWKDGVEKHPPSARKRSQLTHVPLSEQELISTSDTRRQ